MVDDHTHGEIALQKLCWAAVRHGASGQRPTVREVREIADAQDELGLERDPAPPVEEPRTVKATAWDPRTGTRYTDPRSVLTALAPVARITPVDLGLQDYRATIDITDILRDDIAEFPNGYTRSDGSQSKIPCCFTDNVETRVDMLRSQRFPTATGVFALWSRQLAGGQGHAGAGLTSDDPDRPLTGMTARPAIELRDPPHIRGPAAAYVAEQLGHSPANADARLRTRLGRLRPLATS